MKKIYNHFAVSQTHLPAGAFLLPLVFLTLISFSGLVSFVSAQTNVEVCRGTKEAMERLKREEQEAITLAYYKSREHEMRDHLSKLNKAITNGTLLPFRELKYLSDSTRMTLTKEVGKMTPEERAAFQRQARNMIVQKFQEFSDATLEELDQKVERISQQLKVRKDRYNALNCEAVLQNRTGTTGTCTAEGTWTQITDKVGQTEWRIDPDGKAKERGKGNADGKATLSGRTLQIDWWTTNGYSGVYKWILDESCNKSVSGDLKFHTGTTGTYSSSVTRQ